MDSPDRSKQPKTILVVDDDESVRKFVSRILSQSDYQLLVASSGEDALRQVREYKGVIHLLLSNIQMPGITGIELGAQINVERPEIRVMLMSGYTSGMLVLNDGWHFLHKPFIPAQLLSIVSKILRESFSTEEPGFNEHTD
jgi:two-component system cell cycle sensor histidine kinase/response regulator CckA